jgi:hypothetical protein
MALSDAQVLALIAVVLWEPGNQDNAWTPDTPEAIARIISNHRPHLDPYQPSQP